MDAEKEEVRAKPRVSPRSNREKEHVDRSANDSSSSVPKGTGYLETLHGKRADHQNFPTLLSKCDSYCLTDQMRARL